MHLTLSITGGISTRRNEIIRRFPFCQPGAQGSKKRISRYELFRAPLNCALVAEGFGVKGFKVDGPGDLKPTLEKAFGPKKLALVDVHIHSGDY